MPGMRFLVLAGCGCALGWLSGCATYHPAPLSAARNASAIEARSLDDPRLRAFIEGAAGDGAAGDGAIHPQWDLTTLTLAALYFHPDLDVARAHLAAARAGVATAREIPNPALNFEDLSYAPPAGGPAQWTVAPLVEFLVETAGKRRLRTQEAQALVAAARSDLASVSWQVRGGVRDALLALWAAQDRAKLLEQQLDLTDRLAALLDHRLAAGAASALDVARVRTSLNRTRLAVQDAERLAESARAQLADAIGLPLRAVERAGLSFDAFEKAQTASPDASSADLRRRALTDRSDIRGLLADYAAAESALALEVAAQYPNLTLGPGYSFDSVRDRYLLLPSVELPILNRHRGQIAQALARREEAAARFTARQARVLNAVDAAGEAYRAARGSARTADALLAGERNRERRTRQSFAAGAIDRPTLLTVQLERLAAELSALDAHVGERRALGQLEDALQHPFLGPALPGGLEASPRLAGTPARESADASRGARP